MAQKPDEDTEPRVQQLFVEPYRETGMGPQGLSGAGLCVPDAITNLWHKMLKFGKSIKAN